jgi:hypothetical protein
MAQEKEFAEGLYFNQKNDNAPDFVLGSISIDKDKFLPWLDQKQVDGKYLRLDILMGKEKPYICVNTYKKPE